MIINFILAKHFRSKSYLMGVNPVNDNSPPEMYFEEEEIIVEFTLGATQWELTAEDLLFSQFPEFSMSSTLEFRFGDLSTQPLTYEL